MFDCIKTGRYWDKPWTLVSGCTACSPGCTHCWALAMERRFRFKPFKDDKSGLHDTSVQLHPERLDIPLRRKKPTVWAIWNDLFHEDVADEFIRRALINMVSCTEHIFLILTKRPKRILNFWSKWKTIPPAARNIYWGITVCNQQEADEKIPILLQIPAAVRWVSIEPMLGPVDLLAVPAQKTPGYAGLKLSDMLHWVVLGGETGPGARPMNSEWALSIKNQCVAAGVPFFFKKWGTAWGKNVGRLLDGREWNELPERKEKS